MKPENIRAPTGFELVTSAKYRCDAVVMRAWRVFLSSVNFTLTVNFLRDFSLFSDYLLYQNGKLIRWSKTKPKCR